LKPVLRSARWFEPDTMRGFSHRSRIRQLGFSREDFLGKPVIAILNKWSERPPLLKSRHNRHLMKTLTFFVLSINLNGQVSPGVAMQMDPDQLALSLRNREPVMPPADCHALDLWECHPDEPTRMRDISLRWVQLDDDPELEAILVAKATAEMSNVAYVFDKQGTWKLVGSFFCRDNRCDVNSLIRVRQLTDDSPPLVLCERDLGGSGSTNVTIEAFQLRGGKLWSALEVTKYGGSPWPLPQTTRQQVYKSSNRLVIHTVEEQPPGKIRKNTCEVLSWSEANHTFVPVARERVKYCDPRTGIPIAGKSFLAGL